MDYREYMDSESWIEFSRKIRERIGRCENCGSIKELHVHHVSYEHIGEERPQDVGVLCKSCHTALHNEVKRRTVAILKEVSVSFIRRNKDEFLQDPCGHKECDKCQKALQG